MTRRVLLVEIGTPAALPVVTPPAPRPPSNWVPDPRPSPGLPPPTGLAVVSIADAAVLTWTRSVAGGQTIIEAAPDAAGVPGIWREVDRTGADTYTISLPGGPRWVRVRAELNGRTSVATNAVLAEPIPVGDISEFEQELRDLQDLVDAVAAQAAADAAALNARADDLRADIDGEIARALAAESALGDRADGLRSDVDDAIAEISTLGDTTDGLATEINRVETESVGRDAATASTIALLGARNAAGTAFVLDGNTVRVAPDQSLAQWRASVQGEFATQSSRIDNEAQARQDDVQALATTLAAVQATANNAASKAELTDAQSALASDIAAEASRIGAMEVRMPAGSDKLANEARVVTAENAAATANAATASTLALLGAKNAAGTAFVLDGNTVRMSPTETLAQWRASVQGEFATQSSRIDNEAQARQDDVQALATTLASVQATANNAATKAELTSAETALAAADQALSEQIGVTRAALGNIALVENGSFERDLSGWRVFGGRWDILTTTSAYHGNKVLRYTSPGSDIARTDLSFEVEPGDRVILRGMVRPAGQITLGGRARITVRWFDRDGQYVSHSNGPVYYEYISGPYMWAEIGGEVTAPDGAATGYVYLWVTDSAEGQYYFDAIDAVKLSLSDKATASILATTRAEVQENADEIAATTAQVAVHTAEIAGKANTTYVQSVEGTANSAAAQASSNLAALTGLSATVGEHTASINEVREVSASAVSGNAVINPSFEMDFGWDLSGTDSQIITTSAATTGDRALRIQNGNGSAVNQGRAKIKTGQRLRMGGIMRPAGSIPNSTAKLRLEILRYRPDGTYIDSTTVADFPRPAAWQNHPFEVPYSIPAGTSEVALQLRTVDHTSGGFLIDDVYLEPVSESLAEVQAKWGLSVQAGGDVVGMQLLAGGGTSAIRFLSETVGFYSSDGAFELANGRQIARSNGFMSVQGKPFGQSGDLLSWYGPEQTSLNNCTKANGLFWLDNKGDGYFAGRVLQGELRWFNSTSATGDGAITGTGSRPRLGKVVALEARYSYQQINRYRGANASVTPGPGFNRVTMYIERRYGSGAWTILASQELSSTGTAYIGEPGENLAQWTNTIAGVLLATDTAATTNDTEYRARISGRVIQSHTGTGTADPQQLSQYLSIEAKE